MNGKRHDSTHYQILFDAGNGNTAIANDAQLLNGSGLISSAPYISVG